MGKGTFRIRLFLLSLAFFSITIFVTQNAMASRPSVETLSAYLGQEVVPFPPSRAIINPLPETYSYARSDNESRVTVRGSATLVQIVGVDVDGDGLPDAWEEEHFGSLDQNGEADPDGDFFTNIQECELGTDPNDADDAPSSGQRYEYDAMGRLKRVIVIEPRE